MAKVDFSDFNSIINNRIYDLTQKQRSHFAWLCAVRALPFLFAGQKRGYFPSKNNKNLGSANKKNLGYVFYALDISAASFSDITLPLIDEIDAHNMSSVVNEYKSRQTSSASAICAVFSAFSLAAHPSDASGAAIVSEFAFKAARYHGREAEESFLELIISDFKTISRSNKPSLLNVSTKVKKFKNHLRMFFEGPDSYDYYGDTYEELWWDFFSFLSAENCRYWADLYENMYENGFVLDVEELEKRLAVPYEIRSGGASAVGQYMERSKRLRLADELTDISDFDNNMDVVLPSFLFASGKNSSNSNKAAAHVPSHTKKISESRIIILGEKGAGKTSLARRLIDINAKMPDEDESTEGVITDIWELTEEDSDDIINVHIWDFAGHSITHSAHRFFMSSRCLYIYVYNGRIARDNDPRYWLEQIRIHGGNAPVLFLINRKDRHEAEIERIALKREYPSIIDFFDVDIGADNKTELAYFVQVVINQVKGNPTWNKQVITTQHHKIKNSLREHFNKTDSPHISRETFDDIAKICGVPGELIEGVLQDLHALGICLWYNSDDMQNNKNLVLNPDWITEGIYKIINIGRKVNRRRRKYSLTVKNGVRILQNSEKYTYSPDMVQFLFELMRVYELAYFRNEDYNLIYVPLILSVDEPHNLPNFFDAQDILTMSFDVEKFLPPDLISRLIVHRSEYDEIYDEEFLWRKGAVLWHENDTFALIREIDRSIIVKVVGVKKTWYISALRESLQTIFDNYRGIRPDLKYKVIYPEDKKTFMPGNQSYMVSEKDIIAEKNEGRMLRIPGTHLFVEPSATIHYYAINVYNAPFIENSGTMENTHIGSNFFNIQEFKNHISDLSGLERMLRKESLEASEFVNDVTDVLYDIKDIHESNSASNEQKSIVISKFGKLCKKFTDGASNIRKAVDFLGDSKKVYDSLKWVHGYLSLVAVTHSQELAEIGQMLIK